MDDNSSAAHMSYQTTTGRDLSSGCSEWNKTDMSLNSVANLPDEYLKCSKDNDEHSLSTQLFYKTSSGDSDNMIDIAQFLNESGPIRYKPADDEPHHRQQNLYQKEGDKVEPRLETVQEMMRHYTNVSDSNHANIASGSRSRLNTEQDEEIDEEYSEKKSQASDCDSGYHGKSRIRTL